MNRKHPLGLLALCAMTLVAACSTTPEGERRDRLGVQGATMLLIEKSSNPQAKAARVIAAVDAAQTMLELTDVSVSDLRVALLARVAERDLTPVERLAALEIINSVTDEVEKRLGAGLLTPETHIKVNTVLGWVEEAARVYVP